MIDLTTQTARKIAESVRRRELTAVAVTQAALERIGQLNGTLRAFITVTRDLALAAAEEVDRKIAAGQGKDLPLAGVPLAIKDSFWTKGVRTTGGTKVLAGFVPSEDATAVARLKSAGCVLVGKSMMHEMAYGFTSRNPHYGDCRNPWDTTRIPGGSSGGNAAALATGMVLAAVGGDTGGSNRQPAALCGVVGVKVTYGRVSRYGGIPLSWSMDTVGPMSRTVGDAAALVAGHGRVRPQGPDHPPRRRARLSGRARGGPQRDSDRRAARPVPVDDGARRGRGDARCPRRPEAGGGDARRRPVSTARPGHRRAPRHHLQRSGGRSRGADPHAGRRAVGRGPSAAAIRPFPDGERNTWAPSRRVATSSRPIGRCGGRSTCWSRRPARSPLPRSGRRPQSSAARISPWSGPSST